MAKVSLTEDTYTDSVQNDTYDMRKVIFLNQTGTVSIKAASKGYSIN
jgi:hypothetical protein